MRCEICGEEIDTIVILPIRKKDGALCTLACVKCSIASGKYCVKHDMPHIGYDDGTSACRLCVSERISKRAGSADEILKKIGSVLSGTRLEDLNDWLSAVAPLRGGRAMALVADIALMAERTGMEEEEIIENIILKGSAAEILPELFR